MAFLKRLVIVMGVVLVPLLIGLLFTYDVVKINWVSMMGIQPSFPAQRDPLPLPQRSIPIQGAAYIAELGAPVNPVAADDASLKRGKKYYEISCQICHSATGNGKGPFSAFLTQNRPANLLEGRSVTMGDGDIFMTITQGVNGAMPALKENLPTPEMRWDVVNYVRSLQKAK